MKRFLLGSASAAAVVFALSGSANAQVVDIGDIVGGVGAAVGGVLNGVEVDALDGIDLGVLNGLGDTLPDNAGVGGIYQNTAVNIAPQLAANANIAVPLDLGATAATGGLAAALGISVSPNTGSGAVAVDTGGLADLVASLGGSIQTGDQTATAVGVLANQGIQNATQNITVSTDNSTLAIVGGATVSTDEATQAASQAGSAASNSAARYAATAIVAPNLAAVNNTVDNSITGALGGVYAANTALNVAPQIAANLNVGTSMVAADLAATAVGVLANQSISVGLDGAALSGSLTGNLQGSGATTPAAGNAN